MGSVGKRARKGCGRRRSPRSSSSGRLELWELPTLSSGTREKLRRRIELRSGAKLCGSTERTRLTGLHSVRFQGDPRPDPFLPSEPFLSRNFSGTSSWREDIVLKKRRKSKAARKKSQHPLSIFDATERDTLTWKNSTLLLGTLNETSSTVLEVNIKAFNTSTFLASTFLFGKNANP